MEKGQISVQTENIFPIIKKFLYSDQEIFLRELVSNGVDACQKFKTLASRGEASGEAGDLRVEVLLDTEAKTLTIRDNGIGMTAEEVKKYLNQVAFSSAAEFLEKYQDDTNLIGHFGLGFYSAFMVAEKVTVHTLSWKQEAESVTWTCTGSPEYTLEPGTRAERGTDIVLHLSAESAEFLESGRIRDLLQKYCRFLPIPIFFESTQINETQPAWKKQPSELKDEDYIGFYETLFPFSQPPLFWIHLNIDYPFNLTGILYFPKLNAGFELQRNKIQLYSNQVYVTDDVKEIVPEFLTLLHGVIDSPDIPLNVSRSYLQSDSQVRKITGYINKKVAEKLQELFRNDRPAFEQKWRDFGVFIKYGMLSDEKFYEKAQDFALLENVDKQFFTLPEYRDKIREQQTDKNGKLVALYTTTAAGHDSYIRAAQARGYDVLEMDQIMDVHFMHHLEMKDNTLSFVRVDADTVDHLIEKDHSSESVLSEQDQEKVKKLFEEAAAFAAGAQVVLKPLSPEDMPVQITRPEFMRRLRDMQALQGMGADLFPDSFQVVVNSNHPTVVQKLAHWEAGPQSSELAGYLVRLAMLNQNLLKGNELTTFVQSSLKLLTNYE